MDVTMRRDTTSKSVQNGSFLSVVPKAGPTRYHAENFTIHSGYDGLQPVELSAVGLSV